MQRGRSPWTRLSPASESASRKANDLQGHLLPEAEDDLVHLYRYIAFHASPRTARQYLDRIRLFLGGLSNFPERGTPRDEIEPGLRIVGFERRISIAFKVWGDEVVVARILYAGRQLSSAE